MFRRLFTSIAALFAAVVLLYALVVHLYYAFWGATEQEISQALPGDRLTPPTAVVSTSALTIHAPVEQVWPWVVQLGQGRGGFYSYDFFENQFAADMHSAGRIVPELQQLKPGDLVSLQANSTLDQGTAMRVALVEPPLAGLRWRLGPVPCADRRRQHPADCTLPLTITWSTGTRRSHGRSAPIPPRLTTPGTLQLCYHTCRIVLGCRSECSLSGSAGTTQGCWASHRCLRPDRRLQRPPGCERRRFPWRKRVIGRP